MGGEISAGFLGSGHSLHALPLRPKPALVAYVTCGDPDLATTRAVILAAIEAGATSSNSVSRSAIRLPMDP